MPLEVRQIDFRVDEVITALRSVGAFGDDQFQDCKAIEATFRQSGGVDMINLRLTCGEVEKPELFSLEVIEMIGAFIVFCRSKKIPIPKRGKKKLVNLEGSGLSMTIRIANVVVNKVSA